MKLSIRFDTKNNEEIINFDIKDTNSIRSKLGSNLIKFISLDMENFLSNETIASLSKNNYQKVISNILETTKGIIIPETLYLSILIDAPRENLDLPQLQNELNTILATYNKFKKLVEYCYFNDEFCNMTPLQRYTFYRIKFKIEKCSLPPQVIDSFGLKTPKTSHKLFTNDDILIMIQKNSPFLYYSYECTTIDELMTVSFLKLIENDYLILKCKNCGKYFIAYNRTDTLYCDRTSPEDTSKTCKQYGADKAWLERTKDTNDWYSLYRKVYQSLQMKAKRNPEIKQKEFENFRIEAKKMKKALNEKKITEDDIIAWLQKIRKK